MTDTQRIYIVRNSGPAVLAKWLMMTADERRLLLDCLDISTDAAWILDCANDILDIRRPVSIVGGEQMVSL